MLPIMRYPKSLFKKSEVIAHLKKEMHFSKAWEIVGRKDEYVATLKPKLVHKFYMRR